MKSAFTKIKPMYAVNIDSNMGNDVFDYEIAAGYNIEMYSDPKNYKKGIDDEKYYSEICIPIKKK